MGQVGSGRTSITSEGRVGVTCEPTAADPDVTCDVAALGSLYLGGGSAATLAAAGRITGPGTAALGRLLRTDPDPFNAIGL